MGREAQGLRPSKVKSQKKRAKRDNSGAERIADITIQPQSTTFFSIRKFFLQKVWPCQKKAVSLHAFSAQK